MVSPTKARSKQLPGAINTTFSPNVRHTPGEELKRFTAFPPVEITTSPYRFGVRRSPTKNSNTGAAAGGCVVTGGIVVVGVVVTGGIVVVGVVVTGGTVVVGGVVSGGIVVVGGVGFGVQVAVRTTLPLTVPVAGYVAAARYTELPSLHPAKVYPSRVYVFAGVTNVAPFETETGDVGAVPVAPAPPA